MKRNPKVHTALICIGEGAEAAWYVTKCILPMLAFDAHKYIHNKQDYEKPSRPWLPCWKHGGYTYCIEEYIINNDGSLTKYP